MLELREITWDNFHDCAALDGGEWTDTVMFSFAEAWMERPYMEPRAIYNSDRLIGFVSMYVKEDKWQIINFLIDKEYRGQGLGTKSANLCFEYLKSKYKADKVGLPVYKDYEEGIKFWNKLGFYEISREERSFYRLRKDL